MNADDWLSLDQDEREDYLNEPPEPPEGEPREVDCGHSSHDYNVDMERFECCDARNCHCPCAPVPE